MSVNVNINNKNECHNHLKRILKIFIKSCQISHQFHGLYHLMTAVQQVKSIRLYFLNVPFNSYHHLFNSISIKILKKNIK